MTAPLWLCPGCDPNATSPLFVSRDGSWKSVTPRILDDVGLEVILIQEGLAERGYVVILAHVKEWVIGMDEVDYVDQRRTSVLIRE
jgi:hypothetical protein